MNKIIFHSNREYNLHIKDYYPEPTAKSIPEWYSSADKYVKDSNTGQYIPNSQLAAAATPQLVGQNPTCVSGYDAMDLNYPNMGQN